MVTMAYKIEIKLQNLIICRLKRGTKFQILLTIWKMMLKDEIVSLPTGINATGMVDVW